MKYGLSSAILQRTIEDTIRLVTSNHMIRTSFEHVEQVRKNNAANRDRVEKLEVELTHSVQRTEVLEAEKASSEEEVVAATDGADQIRQSCYVARKVPRIFEIDNNISVFARLASKTQRRDPKSKGSNPCLEYSDTLYGLQSNSHRLQAQENKKISKHRCGSNTWPPITLKRSTM